MKDTHDTTHDWVRGYVHHYVSDEDVAEAMVERIIEQGMVRKALLTDENRAELAGKLDGQAGSLCDAFLVALERVNTRAKATRAQARSMAQDFLSGKETSARLQSVGVGPDTTLPPALYEPLRDMAKNKMREVAS